jgi:8-oxo-dGTP pyrophosphatase MutT (NUDIX family)
VSDQNPWKTLSTRITYQNPWISVREDQVIRPDGSPGIYGVVECKIATGVVALTETREVYLVGQYRYATREYSWEIIEGAAHEGETPLDAVQRELVEEAGVLADTCVQLGDEVHLSNSHSSERAFLFMATGLTRTDASPDPTEVLEIRTVPLETCVKMVLEGEIKDAMSIIGILRAANVLA